MADVESARVHSGQLKMFPPTPRKLCYEIGLNWLSALHLCDKGFLSFNPSTQESHVEGQEVELKLLGSLIVAGCDDGMLSFILRGLKKPYQYRLGMIYYDWASQEWQLFPQPEEIDRHQEFQAWLDDLVENGEIEELRLLEASVKRAMENASGARNHENGR